MKKVVIILSISVLVLSISIYYVLTHFTLFHRLTIGGTEYSTGSNGRTFVQILKNGFQPINDAVCKATIYYPDNSYFYQNSPMMPLGENGIYYLDFIAPEIEGVYMLSITCEYPNNLSTYYADQYYINTGSRQNGNLASTYENDRTYLVIQESGGNNRIDVEFYFEPTVNNTKEFDVYFNGKLRKNNDDKIYMYVYNFCDDDWEVLPNYIDYYHPFVGNVIDDNISCYVGPYQEVGIRLYGTGLSNNQQIYIDMIKLEGYTAAAEYITELRGGGEIHVENKKVTVTDIEMPSVSIIS